MNRSVLITLVLIGVVAGCKRREEAGNAPESAASPPAATTEPAPVETVPSEPLPGESAPSEAPPSASAPAAPADEPAAEDAVGDEEAALQSFERAATHAMPAMYGVRVYYHLTQAYQKAGDARKAVRAIAKMMSARDGLAAWKSAVIPLEGTAYGQALRYEIAALVQALADADAGNLG